MDKLHYKSKAIELRKLGLSYNEIRRQIPVSKSTLGAWLKSVPLKEEYRQRLYTKKIEVLSRGPQSQKERRRREVEKILNTATAEVETPISLEAFRFFGAALYWAEGRKSNGFELTNSDPNMIAFMVSWLEKMFGVPSTELKAYLNIYPQQDELSIKEFWSQLTAIPLENFGKSFIKPLSSGYKKNNLYYGTIKIRVPKGTDMRYRVNGWVQKILQENKNRIESLQVRWQSLRETPRPVNISDSPL
jgi:hypothetical protein